MVNSQPHRRLRIGDAVSVPYGRRWLNGTVIERTKRNGQPKLLVSVNVLSADESDGMLSTYDEGDVRTPDYDTK